MKKRNLFVFAGLSFLLVSCSDTIIGDVKTETRHEVIYPGVTKIVVSGLEASTETDEKITIKYGTESKPLAEDAQTVAYDKNGTYDFPEGINIYDVWSAIGYPFFGLSFNSTDKVLFIAVEELSPERSDNAPQFLGIQTIVVSDVVEQNGKTITIEYRVSGSETSRDDSQTMDFSTTGEYPFTDGIDIYDITSSSHGEFLLSIRYDTDKGELAVSLIPMADFHYP
jgi:hypothetical protein